MLVYLLMFILDLTPLDLYIRRLLQNHKT